MAAALPKFALRPDKLEPLVPRLPACLPHLQLRDALGGLLQEVHQPAGLLQTLRLPCPEHRGASGQLMRGELALHLEPLYELQQPRVLPGKAAVVVLRAARWVVGGGWWVVGAGG